MKERLYYLDNIRGLGIIAIVLGHSIFPADNLFVKYLFSWHVALFFLVSGFLFNDKGLGFVNFIYEKFRRLIVPYLFFNVLTFLYYNGLGFLRGAVDLTIPVKAFIIQTGRAMFIGTGDLTDLINSPTWFLVCLFVTSLYYYFINSFIKNRYLKVVFLFVLSVLIFTKPIVGHFRLPFCMDIAVMATFFFGVAHTFKNEILAFAEKIRSRYLLFVPLLILVNFLFLNSANFSMNYYGENYFKFILCSFSGALTILILAKVIHKNAVLSFLGQNSIIILGMEWVRNILRLFLDIVSDGTIKIEPSLMNGFLEAFFTILAIVPIIYFTNRYLYFFVGGKGKQRS